MCDFVHLSQVLSTTHSQGPQRVHISAQQINATSANENDGGWAWTDSRYNFMQLADIPRVATGVWQILQNIKSQNICRQRTLGDICWRTGRRRC
jgi:hypothetical protein